MSEHSFPYSPDKNPIEREESCCDLIHNVKVGLFRNTPEQGRFILANPAMVSIFGYDSLTEIMGLAVTDLYQNPADRFAMMEEVKRNGSVRHRELAMKRKDGTPLWCSVSITAEYCDDGRIKWMDGVIEDITAQRRIQEEQQRAIAELESRVRDRLVDLVDANKLLLAEIAERKRFEEQLREQKQFLEVLLNTIPSPIFYKDVHGIYQGCNSALEQCLGLGREEIIGKTDYDLTSKEVADKYNEMDHLLFANSEVQDHETSFIDANGERHDIIIIKAPYYKDVGKIGGVIGIMVDVTDRRKYEEERLKIDKLESLGVLAGGIAHDFNNIITGILGNISLARIFIDDSHKSAKPLQAAEKASQRAAGLAHQLLTFAKGGVPIKKTIRLQPLLNESVSFIMRGSNVQGIVDLPDTLNAVKADEGQISQAFGNIILNGMQSMPDGGTLRIRGDNVSLGNRNRLTLPPGRYVKIDFIDKGCGISADNLKKIFDPYFTTKEKGTGLGLSSAYSIISRHGGCLDVRSVVGSGTTFSCYLPSTGDILPEEGTGSSNVELSAPAGDWILVMDDDEMIREIAAEILDFLGYKPITCSSGEEAISIYREARETGRPFFAVIMDLTIPGGMGGREAARNILEIDPAASIIVSSGYSNDPVMANHEAYGFCAAVIKPYETMEMSHVLSRIRRVADTGS